MEEVAVGVFVADDVVATGLLSWSPEVVVVVVVVEAAAKSVGVVQG